MISIKDQTALITGGSRGIGRATALLFARAGANVAINYVSDDSSANETVMGCRAEGVRALAIKTDVADQDQVKSMVEQTLDELGGIDILVNNAGIWEHNPIDQLDQVRLQRTIDINLNGTFYPTAAVVPHMKKRKRGTIVNVSSTAGQRGEAAYSPYAATKGAIISLTKSLAPELAPFGIRVNCVAPGWVDTDMSHEALYNTRTEEIKAAIPLGRAATAEELAGPILFLASDLSSFVTGEILNVNGGAVLCG